MPKDGMRILCSPSLGRRVTQKVQQLCMTAIIDFILFKTWTRCKTFLRKWFFSKKVLFILFLLHVPCHLFPSHFALRIISTMSATLSCYPLPFTLALFFLYCNFVLGQKLPYEHALVLGGMKNRGHAAATATTPLNLLRVLYGLLEYEKTLNKKDKQSLTYQGNPSTPTDLYFYAFLSQSLTS